MKIDKLAEKTKKNEKRFVRATNLIGRKYINILFAHT